MQPPSRPTESKLPAITASFWVMKIAATTLGETAGDLLSMTLGVGYAASSLTLVSAFLVCLGLQLAARRYHPPLYWLVILTTSTAGTTMSDYMDRTLGLGYAKGAALLVTLLLVVLGTWRFATGSLSVDRVKTRKAELFYWVAILLSNTLGTALGDFLSDSFGPRLRGRRRAHRRTPPAGTPGDVLHADVARAAVLDRVRPHARPFARATVGDVLTKPRDKRAASRSARPARPRSSPRSS